MFGKKGPRRRPSGAPRPPAPGAGGALETVIVEPGARRRPGATTARTIAAGEERPRLVDLGADWLSTVLALGQVTELPDATALRARAHELKSRFEREAAERGFAAADVDDAVFAMVAFFDETVLNTRGAAREAWIARPWQLDLYGRQLAGEEFFERLERLRRERDTRIEALEVYCCCLAFGFAGRFRLAGPEKLKALLDEVQREVSAVRGGRSPLAPNAGRRQERVEDEAGGLPSWLPIALVLPAILLAFLLVWLFARLGAGHAAGVIRSLGS